jgi:hypothetical protein
MRAGAPVTQLVEFAQGLPDADVGWELLDNRGQLVASGTVMPAAGDISTVITVGGEHNELAADTLAGGRELHWSYTVGGLIISGRRRYRLEAFLPLGLSADGVRRKLGVEQQELEDEGVELVTAYAAFRDTVGATAVDRAAAAGGRLELAACDAIEALAARALLPALQISLAAKQSSGTDQFQRGKIEWDRIDARLEELVNAGYALLNPSVADPTSNFGSLLVAVVRPDPLIGDAQ